MRLRLRTRAALRVQQTSRDIKSLLLTLHFVSNFDTQYLVVMEKALLLVGVMRRHEWAGYETKWEDMRIVARALARSRSIRLSTALLVLSQHLMDGNYIGN